MVEELFPASIAVVAEVDVDEGIVSGPNGLLDEFHAGVLWRPAAFLDVTGGAGTHDVAPGGLAAQRSRDHVVEG